MQFIKPHLDIDAQIALLIERGLNVEDIPRAQEFLSNISYYRLSAYTLPFQVHSTEKNHHFRDNVTFENVLRLYVFDRELRLLVFDMIERLEVAFRTQISYHYALTNGWWFEDPKYFQNNYQYSTHLAKIDSELSRSGEVFIDHYKNKYTTPQRPPSWILFEVITMGLMSKIFRNLKMCPAKKGIVTHFKVPTPYVLESWMHSLTYVRNICAHHSRLWNRVLTLTPQLPKRTEDVWLNNKIISPSKLYAFLSCSLYLLKVVNPDTHFVAKFRKLIEVYPEINLYQMGFPKDWKKEPLWK